MLAYVCKKNYTPIYPPPHTRLHPTPDFIPPTPAYHTSDFIPPPPTTTTKTPAFHPPLDFLEFLLGWVGEVMGMG